MNKREYYYPVIGFLLLFVSVWLFSWILDIVTTFMDVDLGVASLVSSEGMRWVMRNALPALNDVAWGEIMLLISAFGLLQGSGFARLFVHLIKIQRLTKMERRSLVFAVFAVLIYSAVLYVTTLSQWNVLSGVTGTLENSSFVSGLPLLLFFGVLILALVYGFMYGNYRSVIDVVSSIGNTCTIFVPALIALIPASGVIASITYIGIFDLLGLTDFEENIIAAVFYSIPFLHIMFGKKSLFAENL